MGNAVSWNPQGILRHAAQWECPWKPALQCIQGNVLQKRQRAGPHNTPTQTPTTAAFLPALAGFPPPPSPACWRGGAGAFLVSPSSPTTSSSSSSSSSSLSTLSPQLPDTGDVSLPNPLPCVPISSPRGIPGCPLRTGSRVVGGEGLLLAGEGSGGGGQRWSPSRLTRKVMYLMASLRISFLLSFLSGGWVGISFRSSAKAPFTFCCRQRSRLLVKTRRATF
ncbi:hypothetical protein FKM82_030335 [Ascaphus truei]